MAEDQETPPTTTGLEIALQWAQLPPEHLQLALKALEPQLRREHEFRTEQLRITEIQKAESRKYAIFLASLISGFAVAVGLLVGGAVASSNNQPWLALLFAGPSIFALVKLFLMARAQGDELRKIGMRIKNSTPEAERDQSKQSNAI